VAGKTGSGCGEIIQFLSKKTRKENTG